MPGARFLARLPSGCHSTATQTAHVNALYRLNAAFEGLPIRVAWYKRVGSPDLPS